MPSVQSKPLLVLGTGAKSGRKLGNSYAFESFQLH